MCPPGKRAELRRPVAYNALGIDARPGKIKAIVI